MQSVKSGIIIKVCYFKGLRCGTTKGGRSLSLSKVLHGQICGDED